MNDRLRFEEMYRAHGGAVRAFVHRRLPADLADDVTADVFVVAWRRIGEVPQDALPWLLRVTRGVIANKRRSEARRVALVERIKTTSIPDTPAGPESRTLMSERLNAAFAALRESDREVLRLVAWDGLSRHDAATVLDISAAVFSLRLHRARRRLARALGDGGEQERRPDGSSSVEVIR